MCHLRLWGEVLSIKLNPFDWEALDTLAASTGLFKWHEIVTGELKVVSALRQKKEH